MRLISEDGRGVVVLIREPRPTALSERVAHLADATTPNPELRDYGVGAQILRALGVREMVLLSNTRRTIIGLEGHGLSVVGHRPLRPPAE
jgi:3,4-dihydroxy 2-butanone 4-phosphate synthase/GTP cyclohydrolase II